MKKTRNVLGIIAAWLLSIVLVLLLLVSPLTLSVMSMLEADTVIDVVFAYLSESAAVAEQEPEAIFPEKAGVPQAGAPVPMQSVSGSVDADSVGETFTPDILEELFGAEITQEQLDEILQTEAVRDFVETYAEDFADVIIGKDETMQFDAEKLLMLVEKHMDEIVDIIERVSPEGTQIDRQELKQKIRDAVNENAEEIIGALPKPEEVREELLETNPSMKPFLDFLKNKDTYSAILVVLLVVLCGLIFAARLPDLCGLRWLAIDLFAAVPLNAVLGGVLCFGPSVFMDMLGVEDIGSQLISMLFSDLGAGLLLRTGVMLAAAIVLLVAYIRIQKARKNRLAADAPGQAEVADSAKPAEKPAAEDAARTQGE